MTDDQTPADSPTIPRKVPTNRATGKKPSPTKKKNSPTMKQGAGFNKIKQDELVKWTIFVQEETKTFVGKAAQKAGLTTTDWLDSRLRETATVELSHKSKPPAKVEDVADLMTQLEKRLTDQQAQTAQKLAEQMQQQTEALNNRPANLKEWLFGKPKNG